jgi:UTP--glucose-1-phosphate uridylyltransferase
VIQYVVQEAVDSGIEDILIISGKGKRAIEDHFDRNFELEDQLSSREDEAMYHEVRRLSEMANIHFIRQKELNGLGDAIYYARHHTGSEPFALLLGDTILDSVIPATQQLIDIYEQFRGTVLGVETVPKEKVSRYGILGGKMISERVMEVHQFVEKPTLAEAPSNLAICGRYVLTPAIFAAIEKTARGKNNEIQLTDAIRLLNERESVHSYTIEGKRFDIGNKLDYIKTTVEYALKRKEFRDDILPYLKEIVGR